MHSLCIPPLRSLYHTITWEVVLFVSINIATLFLLHMVFTPSAWWLAVFETCTNHRQSQLRITGWVEESAWWVCGCQAAYQAAWNVQALQHQGVISSTNVMMAHPEPDHNTGTRGGIPINNNLFWSHSGTSQCPLKRISRPNGDILASAPSRPVLFPNPLLSQFRGPTGAQPG